MLKRPMDQIFDHWNSITGPLFDDMTCLFDKCFDTVQGGFPPYDVERNAFGVTIISVALAGLKREDIEVSVEKDILNIKYDKPYTPDSSEYNQGETELVTERSLATVFHRGIARRSFHLKFRIMPGAEVTEAKMEDGMLRVLLVRETQEAEVKKIEIQ
jgi:molecular chaperone IbpA